MPEWFSNDSFWITTYPYMFPAESFPRADEETDKLIALSGVSGGALLDLCCGPGRHATAFARRDFRVTGVDRTRFLLDRARERAKEEGLDSRTSGFWCRAILPGASRSITPSTAARNSAR